SELRFGDRERLCRFYAPLRRGLATARGEEPAPWRSLDPQSRPLAPLAWSGAGGREAWPASSQAREPGRISEAIYAPLERTPVPLSGRGTGPSRFRLLGQYKGALL